MDIVELWSTMQSRIFTSVAVGKRNANILVDYEHEDGRIEKWIFGDVIKNLLADALNRALKFPFIAFPELLPYTVTPGCMSYKRNVMNTRNAVQKIMDDRRTGMNKSHFGDAGDLLSILLSDQLYQGDKFMKEITPVLDRCKSDFANLLTTEEVDKFEYVRRCWYETMRI